MQECWQLREYTVQSFRKLARKLSLVSCTQQAPPQIYLSLSLSPASGHTTAWSSTAANFSAAETLSTRRCGSRLPQPAAGHWTSSAHCRRHPGSAASTWALRHRRQAPCPQALPADASKTTSARPAHSTQTSHIAHGARDFLAKCSLSLWPRWESPSTMSTYPTNPRSKEQIAGSSKARLATLERSFVSTLSLPACSSCCAAQGLINASLTLRDTWCCRWHTHISLGMEPWRQNAMYALRPSHTCRKRKLT